MRDAHSTGRAESYRDSDNPPPPIFQLGEPDVEFVDNPAVTIAAKEPMLHSHHGFFHHRQFLTVCPVCQGYFPFLTSSHLPVSLLRTKS